MTQVHAKSTFPQSFTGSLGVVRPLGASRLGAGLAHTPLKWLGEPIYTKSFDHDRVLTILYPDQAIQSTHFSTSLNIRFVCVCVCVCVWFAKRDGSFVLIRWLMFLKGWLVTKFEYQPCWILTARICWRKKNCMKTWQSAEEPQIHPKRAANKAGQKKKNETRSASDNFVVGNSEWGKGCFQVMSTKRDISRGSTTLMNDAVIKIEGKCGSVACCSSPPVRSLRWTIATAGRGWTRGCVPGQASWRTFEAHRTPVENKQV